MSAQEFKPGDRVRCIDAEGSHDELIKDGEYTVSNRQAPSTDTAYLHGVHRPWHRSRFEKVEPERDFLCCAAPSHIDGRIVMPTGERVETTLTVPPASADVEPEQPTCIHCGQIEAKHGIDRVRSCTKAGFYGNRFDPAVDDLEPEPMKEGDWVQAWIQIKNTDASGDGHVFVEMIDAEGCPADGWIRNDAIVRPDAGQVPPWVKPARCTSLYEHVGSLHRCDLDADHEDRPGHSNVNVGWTTADEAGRITESGAS